jgi:opacity protein-like surface antigen
MPHRAASISAPAAVSIGAISTRRSRACPASPACCSGRTWSRKDRRAVPISTSIATKRAPDVQLGYIAPFAGGAWQVGLKFTYKYANITSKENVSVPQQGSFTTVVGTPVTIDFPGFVPITPAEINLRHQLALVPTIGRSFGKVTVYAGGGPALFNIDTKFINAVGFAVIGGTLVNVTGTPVTFSNDDWVWGGVAQVGATYTLGPRWFLDLGYTYARSAEFKIRNSASFSNANGPLTSSGVAFLNTREQITNQSVVLTINRQF